MKALLRATLRAYSQRSGRLLSGAIAFYALLSAAPLFVIALHIAGLFGREAEARRALLDDAARWVGESGAHTVGDLLERTQRTHDGRLASWLGAAVTLYASTRLFSALKAALDHLWDTAPAPLGPGADLRDRAAREVRKRFGAFVMILFVGLVLLVLVFVKASIAAVEGLLGEAHELPLLWRGAESLISFAISAALFALVFKVLPDARIGWKDAFFGALVTSVLFSVGAVIIGLYLGHKGTASLYGAASSVVMLMLWVYYSVQVFFLGATFTAVRARARGDGVHRPEPRPATASASASIAREPTAP
jgi:membrane protein